MKKIITILLTMVLLITTLTGCGSTTTTTTVAEKQTNYYPFITEDGDELKFDMSADKFIDKFNDYCSQNDIDWHISSSDVQIKKGNEENVYYVSLSNTLNIPTTVMLLESTDNNKLGSIVITLDSPELAVLTPVSTTIMRTLGVSQADIEALMEKPETGGEMIYMHNKGLTWVIIDKGNAVIIPYTEEQWEEIISKP